MRGEQAIFHLEIKKKSGLSINPEIHHSKVFSSDHIQQICNQSENDYIPQEPETLRFSSLIIFFFNFAFLIDIIDNIITNSPYNVTRTKANGSADCCIVVTSYRRK